MPRSFTNFQHGYASTLHRSQGRTFDRSYLLYSKHWRASASYVAMTRHRDAMRLFVSRALARDLPTLARQMKRVDERRAASLFHRVGKTTSGEEAAIDDRHEFSDRSSTCADGFRDRHGGDRQTNFRQSEADGGGRHARDRRRGSGTARHSSREDSCATPASEAGGEANGSQVAGDAHPRNEHPAPLRHFDSTPPANTASLDNKTVSAGGVVSPPPSPKISQAMFRAAAKQVGAHNPDAPKPQARRRNGEKDGGGCSVHRSSRLGDKPAVRGRYAGLGIRTAKAGDRTINLGSEPPSARGGCFDISLSNPFGGDNYESGFGHGFEDFSVPPEIGTNQNSLSL